MYRCSECENGWPTRAEAKKCLAFCLIMSHLAIGENTVRKLVKGTGYTKATVAQVLQKLVDQGRAFIGPVTLGFGYYMEQTIILEKRTEDHILAKFGYEAAFK